MSLLTRRFGDNTNVPRILMHGSMKLDLHNLALSISSLCLKHKIVLLPEWIPRDINTIADSISRVSDFDDRSIRRRSDYIIGCVTPAIGPNKFEKLTRLIAPVHNIRGKV